ncbi:hypothetical protein H7F37_04010 [Winogradskyella sp. PAMC22761]|nr:hypothetical protein H7F37_04010 [Winogradskyella sp. PAMC22761]
MKKHRLKIYLKLGILLFGISTFIFACQKDNIIENDIIEQTTAGFKISTIHKNSISQNPIISEQLIQLNQNNGISTDGNLQRQVSSTSNNFTVDTETAKYVEYGNYHSYTFTIDRGFDNGLTENLLLSLQNDGSYKAVLITYDLTDAEKLALSNSELISLSNTPSFEYINDQALVTNLLSRNASEECFAFTQIYNLCCHNQHTELDIINGQNCACDIQPTGYVYEITYSAENCENNGGSNDNDDGTYTPPDDDDNDTSTDNNDNGEGSNSGGNGNDTGNNTGTGNDDENPDDSDDPQDCLEIDFEGNCIGDVTSPIIPIETKDCTELKKNSENATFKLQMGVLKTAVLGDTEKSFGIYNGTHFNPPVSNPACGPIVEGDEGNSGVINRHPNLKATAHNHLKNAVGDRKHIGTFSDDDIYDFSKISEWSDDGVSPILKHE